MPFDSKNIIVSKQSGAFANLVHKDSKTDRSRTVTFALKDCYSHFGVKADKDGKLSIGISLDNFRQIEKFKAIEKRVAKISPVPKPKGQKRFMKCLYEKGDYTTLYLKLDKDQMAGVKPGQTCTFSGTITFSAIYLGDDEKGYGPCIVVRVGDAVLKPAKKRKSKAETDDSPFTDTDDEDKDDSPFTDSEVED